MLRVLLLFIIIIAAILSDWNYLDVSPTIAEQSLNARK